MKTACTSLLALVTLIGFGVISSDVVGTRANQPEPVAQPNCKKTENAGKCGENWNGPALSCGSSCYSESHMFGVILNCVGGGTGGLKLCVAGSCKEIVIRRHCTPDGACAETNRTETPVIPISHAGGDACGNGGTVPVVDPL